MKDRMKILIAYNGSENADAALDDLGRAGLPRRAEVLVLSVYDHWLPAPPSFGMVDTSFPEQELREEKETLVQAERGRAGIRSLFPDWEAKAGAAIGSPASVIVQRADEWKADLIVVGSHERTALGRLLLGSTSQSVVNHAHCSVRVARGRPVEADTPVRIIIGVDGSKGAEAAINAVAGRHWPPGSEARMVNAAWTAPPVVYDHMVGQVAAWIARENAKVQGMIEEALGKLQGAELLTSVVVREEEPKKLLLAEAERWGADSIFVGARGGGAFERFLIGSVSSGVAARAHCSVEIVRVV
ncbi:MAG TPA: universal stress protein [Blastocatellia bacterium]|nr:universal stress protein [Blastocatellia bacterium]